MKTLDRIAINHEVMGGKPCIKGFPITVGDIIGLLAQGLNHSDILEMYPYLQQDDILQALSYCAWQLTGN